MENSRYGNISKKINVGKSLHNLMELSQYRKKKKT